MSSKRVASLVEEAIAAKPCAVERAMCMEVGRKEYRESGVEAQTCLDVMLNLRER
jgi:hypothetical protein